MKTYKGISYKHKITGFIVLCTKSTNDTFQGGKTFIRGVVIEGNKLNELGTYSDNWISSDFDIYENTIELSDDLNSLIIAEEENRVTKTETFIPAFEEDMICHFFWVKSKTTKMNN